VWYNRRHGIYRFEESRKRRTQADTQLGGTAQENEQKRKGDRGNHRSTAESHQRNIDGVSARGRESV